MSPTLIPTKTPESDNQPIIDSCEDIEQDSDFLSLCNYITVPSNEPIGVSGLEGRGGALPRPLHKALSIVPYKDQKITSLALTTHLVQTRSSKLPSSILKPNSLLGKDDESLDNKHKSDDEMEVEDPVERETFDENKASSFKDCNSTKQSSKNLVADPSLL